jgi:exonuclease III
LKVLFWNTKNNSQINKILSSLIIENDIDIVVLAEYIDNINKLLSQVSSQGKNMQQYFTSGCKRIMMLGTIKNVQPAWQETHSSIQIVNNKYILCGVHLISKVSPDNDETRKIRIQRIVQEIINAEKEIGSEHSIIVGDFNVDPYDIGMVGAPYFHSVPIYEESLRKVRQVAEENYYMFYNPMWNFMGDFKKPYGTYYYSQGSTCTYWSILDQVIIRPSVRDSFIDNSLSIITKTKQYNLLDDSGHPNKNISDHLPIVFEIEENYDD